MRLIGFIIFIVILASGTGVLAYQKRDAAEIAKMPIPFREFVKLLKVIGAQIVKTYNAEVHMRYRGGDFFATFDEDTNDLTIRYSNFKKLDFEEYDVALHQANSINMKATYWSCHVVALEPGVDNSLLMVEMCCRIRLEKNLVSMRYDIGNLLEEAMELSMEFSDKFNKDVANSETEKMKQDYVNNDFYNKLAHFLRLRDISVSQNCEIGSHKEANMTIADIVMPVSLDDPDWVVPDKMQLMADGECFVVEGSDNVMKFNVCDFVRANYKDKDLDDIVINLHTLTLGWLISLKRLAGSNDKALYYMMTMRNTGVRTTSQIPTKPGEKVVAASEIEIRLSDDRSADWEVKYMVDEIREKRDKGKKLSVMEELISLGIGGENVSQLLYWAMKYYNAGCRLQALAKLHELMCFMRSHWGVITEPLKAKYSYFCSLVGIIYMDLGQKERAFYYLFAAHSADEHRYVEMAFVKLLCELNDPSAEAIISEKLLKMVNGPKEESEEEYNRRHDFLVRCLMQVLIAQNSLDKAQRLAESLIQKSIMLDFAEEQLYKISEARKRLENEM